MYQLCVRRPPKKPRLSAKNRADRLTFCKRYQNWTEDMWSQVMFSDETLIVQYRNCKKFVRRPPKKRFADRKILKTVRNTPTVMLWGAISEKGRCGKLLFSKGETVMLSNYSAIFQAKLSPFLEIRQSSIF